MADWLKDIEEELANDPLLRLAFPQPSSGRAPSLLRRVLPNLGARLEAGGVSEVEIGKTDPPVAPRTPVPPAAAPRRTLLARDGTATDAE